jgi:hypothetical protein
MWIELIRTDKVKVATNAQNMLLHIVLMLKAWLISYIYICQRVEINQNPQRSRASIENNTPPMGEPKATATPAALAAVTISLVLPLN